ncbi:hypothetical protein GCM10028818_40870 [Spirosoma horti]
MKKTKTLLLLLCSLWSVLTLGQGTQVFTIAPATGFAGTPYQIKFVRDKSKYPLNDAGLSALKNDVALGKLNLTVVASGCVIPAGTIPPLIAPTCSYSVSAPSWLTGLQYKHDGTTMTVQTAGDVSFIAFDTSPKTTFTATNPDGVPIASGDFKGYAQISNGIYTRQWQINKAPTSFSITAKNSAGATYSKVFSATTGANFISLIGTTTDPPSSTTTSPGSGTGVSDGDFVAGAFNFTDLAPASIPGDFRPSLETDKIKVTLDLREGTQPNNGLAGGIRYFTDKTSGNNTISMPVFQTGSGNDYGFPLGTTDDGRGINECLYRYPAPWTYNGVFLGIGDNVNESGDVREHPSRLISYGNDGTTLFTAIEPNQWDGDGLRTGDVFKKWIRVNGNEMRVWYESKFNRTSATGANERQESRFQEAPCDYLNGNYSTVYFYDGDSPYSNGSPRNFRLDDNSGMTPGATFMTENWMAGCDPATGRCQGIILETPAGQMGQFQSKGSYNAEGSLLSSTYIAYYPFQMIDYNIKWRHSVIFVVGTLDEIRAKAYQYTSWKRTLEYRFNKSGRQGWGGRWFNDGGYKESRSTWGPITWTSNEGEIVTPAVALDGSIKKQYVKYRYVSSTRQNVNMVVRWMRARQSGGNTNGTALWNQRFPEGAAVGDDYAKTFSLIADGQWHVKELDFSDRPQWRQIITQVRYTNDGSAAVGESLEVEWISGSVNGPAN